MLAAVAAAFVVVVVLVVVVVGCFRTPLLADDERRLNGEDGVPAVVVRCRGVVDEADGVRRRTAFASPPVFVDEDAVRTSRDLCGSCTSRLCAAAAPGSCEAAMDVLEGPVWR